MALEMVLHVQIPPPALKQFAKMLDDWNAPPSSRAKLQALYEAHLEHRPTKLEPDLFETVAAYLATALSQRVPEDQSIAESYVVAVGPWLAEFKAGDLTKLGQPIQAKGALPAEEWEWIRSRLPYLA